LPALESLSWDERLTKKLAGANSSAIRLAAAILALLNWIRIWTGYSVR
jgi:hypothetical protein